MAQNDPFAPNLTEQAAGGTPTQKTANMSVADLKREMASGGNTIFILDARSETEYNVSHVKEARRVGADDFSTERVWMIDRKAQVVLYGSSEEQINKVFTALKGMNFENVHQLGSAIDLMNENVTFVDNSNKETTNIHVGDKTNLKRVKTGKAVSF